ncbi:MAG: hypothetical protein EAZ89_04150, partial [Bacteroidetes bacterium]
SKYAPRVIRRGLSLLNRFREADAFSIPEYTLEGEEVPPGADYGIGKVVAQRILDLRETLLGQRFTSFSQLSDIQGLGEDKLDDLLQSSRYPAAEAFRRSMYRGVIMSNFILSYDSIVFEDEKSFLETAIMSNFILSYDSIVFEDEKSFLETAASPQALRSLVAARVAALCYEKYHNQELSRVAPRLLENLPLDTYTVANTAAYALALWFYRFDSDNWFTFDRVLKACMDYLEYYDQWSDRAELYFFKGFDNTWVLADPVTVSDLPFVVNYAEQSITLWTCQLND